MWLSLQTVGQPAHVRSICKQMPNALRDLKTINLAKLTQNLRNDGNNQRDVSTFNQAGAHMRVRESY